MPAVLPLIAAAGSIGAGMAAVGGTMAGFAAATLGTQLVAGAMIAGGALTAVGALTGNKTLAKWGGVLSLAGGIGGLATGAWTSAAESIAGDAASAGFGGAEYGMAEAAAGGMTGTTGTAASAISQANAGTLTDASGAFPVTTAQPVAGAPAITAPPAGGFQAGQPISYGAQAPQSSGLLGNIGDKIRAGFSWASENPNNARIVQAGAGLIGSLGQGYAQQEAAKEQIRAQEDARARARQRLNDSMTGLKMPVYKGA